MSSVRLTVQTAAASRSKHGPSSQPANSEPLSAATLSVIPLPSGKIEAQLGGQLTPLGELVTTPLPFPDGVTLRVWPAEKTAVRVWLNEAVTVHVGTVP